ncbi:MAG: PAS domain S-box protein [Pyrinomonadaceae bacterium]|nr:PAS domain S-box protein [Pyrinomonadaceae bacterium]
MSKELQTAPLPLRDKIKRLMFGRMFVLIILIIASWFWRGDSMPQQFADFGGAPLTIFIILLAVSIVYAVLWRTNKFLLTQATVQFIVDALLLTWLIWATGDVKSPYITLYTVLICLASVFFGSNGTLLMAAFCTFLFTTLATLTAFDVLPHLSNLSELLNYQQVLQIVGFHDVAFLVVGLLAAQLPSLNSRSNVRLRETTQTLANLQILHERIVQSIRSGLVTTDLDGKIYIFNSAAEDITGYKSFEVNGWKIFDLLGNIEQPIAVSLEAAKNSEQPPRFEIDFSTPEGFVIRLGYGISPLFSESGETSGLIITFQDLTEMRSMEESIRRKDRLAAVGRVAAGLAHEIRNPLGAMRGAIQVLGDRMEKDSMNAQLIDIVLRESDRLNTIITNFLHYARPKAAEFAETNINELIHDTVSLLGHSPDVRSIHELSEDLPEKPLMAFADAAQLKQVFWNLARNALQAMPNGGKFAVKLRKLSNNRLQITFADTGCGMSASQVERLFEPFSQSTTGGTGLGLSIVYQIIRDHNGTINVRSQANEGTTITLEMPMENSEIKQTRKFEFVPPLKQIDG